MIRLTPCSLEVLTPTFCQTWGMQVLLCSPLKRQRKTKTWPQSNEGWDVMKLEEKALPRESLLNLNLPRHSKYLPER